MAGQKLKFNIKRIPPKPKINKADILFSWDQRPVSDMERFTGGAIPYVPKHDLRATVVYDIECVEDEIKDGEFDYNSIMAISYISVLAPAEFGGSLYFKSFGDGFRFDGQSLVTAYALSTPILVATQETWNNSPRTFDFTMTFKIQYFARMSDIAEKTDLVVTPDLPMLFRSERKVSMLKGVTVGAPPAPAPIPPFKAGEENKPPLPKPPKE